MRCVECGKSLSDEEIAMHDCSTNAALDDAAQLCAQSLYPRLLTQPFVSLIGAYGSTVTEDSARDEILRLGLSNLVAGPPLPMTRQHVLTHEHAQLFVAAATMALNRVKDPENDDFLHYSDPPLQYRLLAAVLRQAARAEHVVALITALSVPAATPHLLIEESCWQRHDDNILGDAEFSPNPQVLRALEVELSTIAFDHQYASDDTLKASRSFLWKDRDEFLVTVLHVMLLSRIGDGVVTALPSLSASDACSWLPRMTALVAMAIGPRADVAAFTRSAVGRINANPLESFTNTCLARAFPIALDMTTIECVKCSLVVPRDCVVKCGARVLCKLCYETISLEFAKNPGNASDRKDHKLAIGLFRSVVADEVAEKVSRSIAVAEEGVTFDTRFHCPLNIHHPVPFHAPMPEHPTIRGAPVGITCPECSVRWCAQCRCADHPHAATCGEVTNTKLQWSAYADNMKKAANIVISEFDNEAAAAKDFLTDRVAGVERRRLLLQRQISRLTRDAADIDNAIRQIHQSNHDEMTWAGDGGWEPRVIGSRRCPHCGRQPIKRTSRCASMICGQNSEGGGNFQGGCFGRFVYTSPEAAYQPISTANQENEKLNVQSTINRLTAALQSLDTQITFPPPVLANHWPTLACSGCQKRLLGDFHIQCFHCQPPYLLCVYCIRKNKHNEHADPMKESGHVFAMRKPQIIVA
jgi:hypothetical protein